MTIAFDEEKEYEQHELDDLEEVVDETFRKCKVAMDTQTLQKLYNMTEDTIDESADRFIEKFNFFSLVSTKEEYTMLKFDKGDFHKEHVECSGLNDDSDGSSRRICVYLIIEAPKKGGEFNFTYQGVKIVPQAGSILMFPSCPLHPLQIEPVKEEVLSALRIFYCRSLIRRFAGGEGVLGGEEVLTSHDCRDTRYLKRSSAMKARSVFEMPLSRYPVT